VVDDFLTQAEGVPVQHTESSATNAQRSDITPDAAEVNLQTNLPAWRHTHTVRTEAASRRDDLAISMINRVKRYNLVTADLAAGRSTR